MKNLVIKGLELALSAFLLVGCRSIESLEQNTLEQNKEQTNTGRFFREFPEEIEMAGYVKKFGSGNAKYCLIHVLQMHVSSFDRKDPYSSCTDEKNLENINLVQNDIYDILLQLKYNFGISGVYQEGLHRDEKIWDERNPRRKLFYYLEYPQKELVEETEFWNYKFNLEKKEKYKRILEEKLRLKETLGERYPFLAGASFLMADDDLLRLKYGENGDFYKEGLKSNLSFGAEKNNHELRENALLEMIEKNRDETAVVVFGGAHCWKNNIRKWNKMHQNEGFSLIEIVPESYHRIYGRH